MTGRAAAAPRPPVATLVAIALLLAAAPFAAAQTDTGRHRPPRPAPALPDTVPPGPWQVAVAAGLASGGDLFRARAGGPVPWDPEGGSPFAAAEFDATLDEGLVVGVAVSRTLGSWLRVRADLAASSLPIAAEARVSETVRVHEYDDLSVLGLALGLEARLARAAAHPYLLAQAGATRVGAAGTSAYDQTVLAAVLGAGFHQPLSRRLALRLEARDRLQSIDFADYRPPVDLAVTPNVTVANRGPQHLVELVAGLVAGF